jgi:hypothetical protein
MVPTVVYRKRLLNPICWVLPASVALLVAADPAWKKPISDWSNEDAQLILTNSPWAKLVTAGITRKQTEDERRAGGEMGDAKGVGFDGVDVNRPKPKIPHDVIDLVKPDPYVAPPAQYLKLRLRWESALPVRVAELKSGVVEPPTLESEGYIIAVYGVPGTYFKGDPKTLGEPLKSQAFLRREGKKDVKPSTVEVFVRDTGPVVVYEFPLSAEISKKDVQVDFAAQIGRLVFSQTFNLDEMQFQGKPAL